MNTSTTDVLVRENMGLICSYARRYDYAYFQDIVQDGCIGLLRAAQKFEANRGTKFSTYAAFWINQATQRGFNKLNRPVRIPSTALECIRKIQKIVTQFMTEEHRAPSNREIAVATGIAQNKIDYYQQLEKQTLSLDAIVASDDLPLNIEDHKALDYQTEIDEEGKNEALEVALRILPVKERFIIEQSFGFTNETDVPLAEIGRNLGISRERVRQLREQALGRIRKHPIYETLKRYL